MRKIFLTIFLCVTGASISAQDYSKRGLMEIKEQSDARRMTWIKAFEDGIQKNDYSSLPPMRQSVETYIDQHMTGMRRLYAQGDARGILTAVNNYLQIQKQFVKDVMVSAESLKPNDKDGVERINQKINDFGQKEKIFLVEINNALMTEPDDDQSQHLGIQANEDEEDGDQEPDNLHGSMPGEGKHAKKKGKLPHEISNEGKQKRRKRSDDE